MTHVEYWIANDGTRFEDEYDCAEYELKQKANTNHTLRAVKGSEVCYGEKLMEDEVYNTIDSVIVSSEDDLKLLSEIQDYTGFYGEINSVGIWKYDYNVNKWVRKENTNEN